MTKEVLETYRSIKELSYSKTTRFEIPRLVKIHFLKKGILHQITVSIPGVVEGVEIVGYEEDIEKLN